MQERKVSGFLIPEPSRSVVGGVKIVVPLMVEIVAHNAPVVDVIATVVVVVVQLTFAAAVKQLARDDDVAEEYVTFEARIEKSLVV